VQRSQGGFAVSYGLVWPKL